MVSGQHSDSVPNRVLDVTDPLLDPLSTSYYMYAHRSGKIKHRANYANFYPMGEVRLDIRIFLGSSRYWSESEVNTERTLVGRRHTGPQEIRG